MKIKMMMERNGIPEKIGGVTLRFNSGVLIPFRNGDIIFFPENIEGDISLVNDNKQFVLWESNPHFDLEWWDASPPRPEHWFGGFDESPFLTGVEEDAWKAFSESGEKGFFNALKPALILHLEKRYGAGWQRQGEIFAFPLNPSLLARTNRLSEDVTGDLPVFHTHHKLHGTMCRARVEGFECLIGIGTLTADDHSPRVFKKPHALAVARFLMDPD
ncbi:MAG: hypothetical protein NUV53_04790 [Patescibacteria group bacterium]|nr:hypothetical protein [Patescibacteria group bacterium]